MGINNRVFELLMEYGQEGRALAAGYPDIVVDDAILEKALGTLPEDSNHAAIKQCHDSKNIPKDAHAVFNALGYELDVIDIFKHRGTERIFDLNTKCFIGMYDMVIDHGTIEHCFNIGQAAINLANAVKVGGLMVQHLPLSMYNHGFYNLNPTWFHSFYPQNGFEILHFEGMMGNQVFQLPGHQRFYFDETNITNNIVMTMVAKRTTEQEIIIPIQYKYKNA